MGRAAVGLDDQAELRPEQVDLDQAVERDRHRDAVHRLGGLEPLRFSCAQVTYEPALVERLLSTTAAARASARPRS